MTCYNRVETTLRCLRLLFAQEMPAGWALDVWLVDDASPDGSGEKVKAEFPQVNVIRGTGKLFWCKGTRLAWDTAAAAKDYNGYLWLNDDVVLASDAIMGLVKDVEATKDSAILIGAFRRSETDDWIAYGVGGSDARRLRPNGKPQKTTGVMSGNFVYVPKSVFRKIGPIYGGYSHCFGDHDYGCLADRSGVARYLCSQTVGICPQQPERYHHKLKSLSVLGRIKVLFAPKGFSIRDNFIYKYRNFGLVNALASVLHVIWIRVVLANER